MTLRYTPIPGHDGYYANSYGIIFNNKGYDLTQTKHYKGYLYVSLGAKAGKMYVHRLIAETFIPNPENKPQVNHKDGNKMNNHVSNLEWVTGSENQTHAYKSGLLPKGPTMYGKDNPNSVPIIYNGIEYCSITDAMKATGHGQFRVAKHGIRKAPK